MALIRCEKGHFYDSGKYNTCPYCASGAAPNLKRENSSFTPGTLERDDSTEGYDVLKEDDKTVGYDELASDERTIGVAFSENGSPVTGWLVCTAGPERGRDYRLHEGRNFVGRSLTSDVVAADIHIARENHFSVVYDGRNNLFLIVPGEGTQTCLDGKTLTEPEELTEDMTIQAGKSRFAFRSFCRGKVQWSEMDEEI